MAFTFRSVSVADTPGLTQTMMRACNGDPHWVTLWVHPPVMEELILASEGRLPWNLINAEKSKRHQKAVDTATDEVVGYARWDLPPVLAEKRGWEEAQLLVDDITSEERVHIENKFKVVTENARIKGLDHAHMDFRNKPLVEADARINKNGPYLSEST